MTTGEQMHNEALKGAEGTILATSAGLRYERTRMSAAACGAERISEVPWSQVVGATVDKKALRVQLAGVEAPSSVVSDPWALSLKHGQADAAEQLAATIRARAFGADAEAPEPPLAAAVAQREQPSPVVAAQLEQQRAVHAYVRAANRSSRVQNIALRFETFGLVMSLVATGIFLLLLVAFVGIVVWFAVS